MLSYPDSVDITVSIKKSKNGLLMTNEITFISVHKSIIRLPDASLPKFVVLTGKNGSGKTHLLEAIDQGKVKSSLVEDQTNDVLLFDWNTIIPKDTGIFHPHQHQTQRSNWFTQIRSQQDAQFSNIQQQVINLGIPVEYCSSLQKIKKLTVPKLKKILTDPENAETIHANLQQQLKQFGQNIFSQTQRNIGDEDWKIMAPKVASEKPELFLENSESKFFNNDKFLWGKVDAFQQAFGRVFSTYRDLIHQNDRFKKYPPDQDSGLEYLEESEFISKYGEPPWDFVNHILEVSNLDFRVEPPPLHEVSSYEPKLVKITSDIEMRFQDLSSGEKILMSFALCLYNAEGTRQEVLFPKLLMLDEVDAPLHPSMVRSLLNTIQEVLIENKNVSVILTTHSPSTVALAPEESLYEMNSDGPSIKKISRSKAISILTMGVPTLSVSFDGRRQVFVESRTDASIYDKLYQFYKQHLGSERSLVFIEVGKTNESGGEQNSGCEQVQRLVLNLSEAGNNSVFGLVDWDGERQPTDRVHVLSHGVRDGLESLLFDPVLIITTVIREHIQFCKDKKIIENNDTYIDIGNWTKEKWQQVVNKVQNIIIGEALEEGGSIEIEYANGMSLNIFKNYLHLDDHQLESKIIDCFGFLKPKNKRAGGLMTHIVISVLPDYPKLIPKDLLKTFQGILNASV